MISRHSRRRIAVVLSAGLLFAAVAATIRHTESSGGPELDCFACYWAIATTAEAVSDLGHGFAWVLTGPLVATAVIVPVETPAPELASRGPPSA
jgi:hypothetical protein